MNMFRKTKKFHKARNLKGLKIRILLFLGRTNLFCLGHVAAVRCVQYDGRLVVSGAYDYMVKVWLFM